MKEAKRKYYYRHRDRLLAEKKERRANGLDKPQYKPYRFSIKTQARQKVGYALKMGVLKKEPCKVCGKSKVEGHHEDYTKPLEVIWLCPIHHASEHTLNRIIVRELVTAGCPL